MQEYQIPERPKSGDWCECGHCHFVGYCYGTITSNGGTAPWCPKCGMNDDLKKVARDLAH